MSDPAIRRRAVVVSTFFPLPQDRGDPIRVLMFMRELAKHYELTILATRRSTTTEKDIADLRSYFPGIRIEVYEPRARGDSPFSALLRWISAVVYLTPSWVRLRQSRALQKRLKAWPGPRPDRVFLLGEAASSYITQAATIAPCHIDKSNVLGRSVWDEASTHAGYRARQRLRIIALVSRAFEWRTLRLSSSISTTSAAEDRRLRQLYFRGSDAILPSCIELVSSRREVNPAAGSVLWLGSFSYSSNVDGLRRFIEQGLPILAEHGLSLEVVGSGDSGPVRKFVEGRTGVHVRGFVDDLDELPRTCRAAVVPLWSGAGVKLKTLTLLDLGLPVAGTPVAMEGLPDSAALAVRSSPEALASCIVGADTNMLLTQRQRGFEVLDRSFSVEGFSKRLSDLVDALERRREQ